MMSKSAGGTDVYWSELSGSKVYGGRTNGEAE
jgi:hypothetical protein